MCTTRAGSDVLHVPHSLLVGVTPLSPETPAVVGMRVARIHTLSSAQTSTPKVERISLCGTE
jgi:hypothetical protein